MKDVHLSPRTQVVGIAAVAAVVATVIAANVPDIKRYMKLRSM